jgi:hypothetical protein
MNFLTEEQRQVLALLVALVFGMGLGLPLGILIEKDGKR